MFILSDLNLETLEFNYVYFNLCQQEPKTYQKSLEGFNLWVSEFKFIKNNKINDLKTYFYPIFRVKWFKKRDEKVTRFDVYT